MMPIGAELQPGGVHFRVWAPKARSVCVHLDGRDHALESENDGYAAVFLPGAGPGARYGFRLDDAEAVYPDPASRSQPDGPHGLSAVVDPAAYVWQTASWPGVTLENQVICEVHIGTFTEEGTWRAAAEKLPQLLDAGITVIEMMPVAEFPGRFGWGYDGVSLFAPTRLYGAPDDLRSFVDRAHALSMGVILDVVYNHFGPDGNYLGCYSDDYVTDKYDNEWGDAVNFDGANSRPVRDFVCENAAYWIREFRLDGLRIDATQQMFDESAEHIMAEIARRARAAADGRQILMIAENEPQQVRLVQAPSEGGYGLDAMWNDDFHHTTHVALTAHSEAYFSDYTGSATELLSCFKHGFLYQGQRSTWQKKARGSAALGIERARFVSFLENHDQIANTGAGRRLAQVSDPGRIRTLTAFMYLTPGTPMLFQGQEFASSAPFMYFADHKPELAELVAKGRREFMLQFPSLARFHLGRPDDPKTFRDCVLDWSEREANSWAVRFHRDLAALRRNDPVINGSEGTGFDANILGDYAFIVRFFGRGGQDRLMILNFGRDLVPRIFPEPLLAPLKGFVWHLRWSSEDPAYGGGGIREPLDREGVWVFPGLTCLVMAAKAAA
jgi:maltooligosyltrehalose trehalohydrolase